MKKKNQKIYIIKITKNYIIKKKIKKFTSEKSLKITL